MFKFTHTYASLPDCFYRPIEPTPSTKPSLLYYNEPLSRRLSDHPPSHTETELAQYCSGSLLPDTAHPIATVYAAHQFGNWVPQLGDGRAILLGEVKAPDQNRHDIQLKGAGPTPYSRRGDGRATLGSVLRECVISEFMHTAGIASSRALAVALTGDTITRDARYPSAVLTRTAHSFIRFGTFQYFSAQGDTESVKALADYAIDRLYPRLKDHSNPYLSLFQAVAQQQAKLIAQWQLLGFIHGVMNTDNTTLSCETIDYGPCAFMDTYHENTVFSSIDQMGRYAYKNQPAIGQWNLSTLAECLLPLLSEDTDTSISLVKPIIEEYANDFYRAHHEGLCQKIGLPWNEENLALAKQLLSLMQQHNADFTLTFRALIKALDSDFSDLFAQFEPSVINAWLAQWRERQDPPSTRNLAEFLRQNNPLYIPRNHQIERMIQAANHGNHQPFHDLMQVLASPFTEQDGKQQYALPPEPQEVVHQTFCGT